MPRYIAQLILVFSLAGCAIYDSQRGPLVTSSPQTVLAQGYTRGSVVIVDKFDMPASGTSSTVSTTGMVGLTTFPISHTYIFNEVDRKNLRLSLVNSLRESGLTVIEPGGDLNDVVTDTTKRLNIEILVAGMIDASYGVTVPYIEANIGVINEAGNSNEIIRIMGNEKMSVIGSKEDGIRKFVSEIHRMLGGAV